MSAQCINKQFIFKRTIPARVFAWLMVFCILSASSLPIFGQQILISADLVFCPLQKMWVEKYVPPVKVKEPLAEICASNREKSRFFFEVSKKVPLLRFIPNSKTAEKLFFNYLEKGKQALAEISSSQNLPERELAKSNAEQKSTGGGYKTNFDKTRAEIFTLEQAARPPTNRTFISFHTNAFSKLDEITRRIQPRAPPVRS